MPFTCAALRVCIDMHAGLTVCHCMCACTLETVAHMLVCRGYGATLSCSTAWPECVQHLKQFDRTCPEPATRVQDSVAVTHNYLGAAGLPAALAFARAPAAERLLSGCAAPDRAGLAERLVAALRTQRPEVHR